MSYFYVVTITSFKDSDEPKQYLFKDELKAVQYAYTKLLSNSYFEHPNRWNRKISDEEIKNIYDKYKPQTVLDESKEYTLDSSIEAINKLGFERIFTSISDMCDDGDWSYSISRVELMDE